MAARTKENTQIKAIKAMIATIFGRDLLEVGAIHTDPEDKETKGGNSVIIAVIICAVAAFLFIVTYWVMKKRKANTLEKDMAGPSYEGLDSDGVNKNINM